MMPESLICRICGLSTKRVLDLGATPPANWLLDSLGETAPEYPLVLEECTCGNFQLGYCLDANELYRHYNYVTPNSALLNQHYIDLLEYMQRQAFLSSKSRVLEIGSNVGLFLQFLKPHVQSVIGVDPAQNLAKIASANGVETLPQFFSKKFAGEYRTSKSPVDVIVARHCMAHNRDPYEVLGGVVELLSDDGVFVMENAYAIDTFENNEFDQLYHEHMFYYTLLAVRTMFERVGLVLCDVLFSEVHGGSIVCFGKKRESALRVEPDVAAAIVRERALLEDGLIERFVAAVGTIQQNLRDVISRYAAEGKTVYGYGATAKGATLLNATGLTARDIPYCADSTLIKQRRFIPKAGTEIVSEEWAFTHPPDAFLLTAWNYKDELIAKARSAGLREVKFIVPVPSVEMV